MARQSIKQRLFIYLLSTMLISGVSAFGLSLYFSYQEAKEFQDITLKQVAQLYSNGIVTNQNTHNQEYQLSVFLIGDSDLPTWLPSNLNKGFYTLNNGQEELRVLVGENNHKQGFAIAQPTSERDEIVLDSALQTLIPLITLFPLTGLLIWLILRNELKSIEELARKIDSLVDEVPKSLPEQTTPMELQGFINAINQLLNRLHKVFVRQQRFTADAAHELRTPLAALSLQVQNLEKATNLEEMKTRLKPLKSGIERSQRLTEQLLDMNRSQVQKYEKSDLSLEKLLLELLSLYWPKAEHKTQQLLLEGADITLNTHPEAFMLILGNALDNAIKYAPEGSEIIIRVIEDSENVLIQVENQGEGIHQHTIENAFEPFVRAIETDIIGNGLGLAIAKAAAIQLHAQVELQNKANNTGVVFTLIHPK